MDTNEDSSAGIFSPGVAIPAMRGQEWLHWWGKVNRLRRGVLEGMFLAALFLPRYGQPGELSRPAAVASIISVAVRPVAKDVGHFRVLFE